MSSIKGYKCPHCYYYMWEGKEFYECDIQDRVSKLEQENTELKTENAILKSCLQEIKAIAEGHTELCTKCEQQIKECDCADICNAYRLNNILQLLQIEEVE